MEDILKYEAVISIIVGIVMCFFGYRIKKVAFIVIWFIIGYYLANLAVPHITSDPTWSKLIPVGVGLVTGMLGFSIEKFCIFAIAAFTVATTIIETFQLTELLMIGLAIGAGVVVGCIAVSFIKPLGIITTALSGAKLIAKYAVAGLSLSHYPYFILILVGCAVIGMLFQFKNCRHVE